MNNQFLWAKGAFAVVLLSLWTCPERVDAGYSYVTPSWESGRYFDYSRAAYWSRQGRQYDADDFYEDNGPMLPSEGYGIIPDFSGHIDDGFGYETRGSVNSILGRYRSGREKQYRDTRLRPGTIYPSNENEFRGLNEGRSYILYDDDTWDDNEEGYYYNYNGFV